MAISKCLPESERGSEWQRAPETLQKSNAAQTASLLGTSTIHGERKVPRNLCIIQAAQNGPFLTRSDRAGNDWKTIAIGAACRTWRSVNGDRLSSGLSPFYFESRVARSSGLCRRSGVPAEALAGRKAGTDQGTAVNDRGRGNSRRLPHVKARKGRFERRGREASPPCFMLTPEQFTLRQPSVAIVWRLFGRHSWPSPAASTRPCRRESVKRS